MRLHRSCPTRGMPVASAKCIVKSLCSDLPFNPKPEAFIDNFFHTNFTRKRVGVDELFGFGVSGQTKRLRRVSGGMPVASAKCIVKSQFSDLPFNLKPKLFIANYSHTTFTKTCRSDEW